MGQDNLRTTNVRLAAASSGVIYVAGRTPKVILQYSGKNFDNGEHGRFQSFHLACGYVRSFEVKVDSILTDKNNEPAMIFSSIQ